ncbi:MAG: hypothetical protein SOR57_02510 [Parabacteroides sp.]|nr:hypothetical protein [Parabacteroides sp.]
MKRVFLPLLSVLVSFASCSEVKLEYQTITTPTGKWELVWNSRYR